MIVYKILSVTAGETSLIMSDNTPHSIAINWSTTGGVGLETYLLQCFENQAQIQV